MSVPGLLLACGLSFVFLCFAFRPLEMAFPARRGQRFFRPAWLTDLAFFAGQYLVWNGLIFWLLAALGFWLDRAVPHGFRAVVGSQHWFAQAIEVVTLSDLCVYWGHRLQHRVSWLWRFHAIHHSAEHLDWLAAHREHPIDTVYTLTLINLPAFLLGFPLETLAGLIAFRGVWAIYIHSNVRLPIGPLRVLVGAPELHHWHHDRDRDFGNYANISPLMDVFFGTYHCPDHEPDRFGIVEEMPKGYLAQLAHPFRGRGRRSNSNRLPRVESDGGFDFGGRPARVNAQQESCQ
ncbi:MAG TPA: sterol desaturase family protein [Planctomycetaceae bacterium]|jgi:sterol desaturase/sphingolipid hydroxylase (fatty acid hydroxylase superfamily)|nr:sterol desaturase family protein [Planctomycetaceae bacterium]